MWIKKSQDEISREIQAKRVDPKIPIYFAFFFGFIVFLNAYFGFNKNFVPAKSLVESLDESVLWFGSIFLVIYSYRLIFWTGYDPKNVICNQCFTVKSLRRIAYDASGNRVEIGDDNSFCECSGKFEPLYLWKYKIE